MVPLAVFVIISGAGLVFLCVFFCALTKDSKGSGLCQVMRVTSQSSSPNAEGIAGSERGSKRPVMTSQQIQKKRAPVIPFISIPGNTALTDQRYRGAK